MTKKIVISTIVSAVVMFGLPALILNPSVNDAKVYFLCTIVWVLMTNAIHPLFMVFIGIFIGAQFNKLWFVPIIPAALFTAAIWVAFSNIIPQIMMFPLRYLVIGEIAGLLTFLVKEQKLKNKGKDNG
ncbi:MAG: hypothetical protein ACI4JZ_03755 [Oscillospiraceae bacterium]